MTLHIEELSEVLEREKNQAEEIGTFPRMQFDQDIFSLSRKYESKACIVEFSERGRQMALAEGLKKSKMEIRKWEI